MRMRLLYLDLPTYITYFIYSSLPTLLFFLPINHSGFGLSGELIVQLHALGPCNALQSLYVHT